MTAWLEGLDGLYHLGLAARSIQLSTLSNGCEHIMITIIIIIMKDPLFPGLLSYISCLSLFLFITNPISHTM